MMNWVKRFKSLPIKTKRLLGLGIVLALVAALPLFIWAIVTQRFLIFKRAATGEPGVCVPVGNTITVTPESDGSGTCHSIQAAIDAVTGNGYTINIRPGVYNVSSTIRINGKTNLSIVGDEYGNVGAVTINRSNDFGVLVENSTGSFRWFTLTGGSSNGMFSIHNSNNFRVSHAKITSNSSHTMDIQSSSNITIENTEIESSAGALEVWGSSQVGILNNKIHDSANAIVLDNVGTVEVVGNLIYSNNENGIKTYNTATNVNIRHNTLINNAKNNRIYSAILLSSYYSTFNISNNIVAFNHGPGIKAEGTGISANFTNNDVWANDVNYVGVSNPTGTNGNISADPLLNFSANYCLKQGSPAIYGNYQAGEYMGATWPCGTYPMPSPIPTIPPSASPVASPTLIPSVNPTATPSTSPPPTVRPFKILFKFQGVSGDEASYEKLQENYAKVVVRFVSQTLNYYLGYTSSPIGVTYEGNGVYSLYFGVWSADLPPGVGYSIYLKGEKHLATKFCVTSGQTTHCTGTGGISIPQDPHTRVELDFTGIPLEPGDLYPQDGAVTTLGTNSDLAKLLLLLAKPPSQLTEQDLLVGDLDYSGSISIRDLFLLRQTLQTKYDDN